ncbi:MAG: CHAT domain-containing protein [Actinomycetota bacterium]
MLANLQGITTGGLVLRRGWLSIQHNNHGRLLCLFLIGWLSLEVTYCCNSTQAQAIAPANDGTGTVVTPVALPQSSVPQSRNASPIRFDINGGQLSSDRANLFHSFQQFNLREGQIANFISNPEIRNILARVVGGNASLINGLITVTGGNSNLFLMNPAGIIFGQNASLNVPRDFTATTANRINFNGNWFNSNAPNNYYSLLGEPSAFYFAPRLNQSSTEAIINAGNLVVKPGQNLTLLGRRIINQGQLEAAGGRVQIAEVPGEKIVRISQSGHLLNLEIQTSGESNVSADNLPQMLTGSSLENATGSQVNANGQIRLFSQENISKITTNQGINAANLQSVFSTVSLLQLEAGKGLNNASLNLPNSNILGSLSAPALPAIALASSIGANSGKGEMPVASPPNFLAVVGDVRGLEMGPNLPSLMVKLDAKMQPSNSPFAMQNIPNADSLIRRLPDGSLPRSFGELKFNPNNNGLPKIASTASSLGLTRDLQFAAEFGDEFLNNQVTPQSIRETLGKITAETGNRAAIIYITAFSDQLELILFTPDGIAINKSVPEASRAKILAVAKEFRAEITNPSKHNSTSYLASAQQLYQWLISPLEDILQKQGINTLLFSMDSGLRSIPLAALHDGKQFLIEKYSFSLIPSLSLTDTRYQSLKNASVLAMGASHFNNLAPLPGVSLELSMIVGNLWPGKTFLNQEFTLNNLKVQRREYPYQIIHLATHGEFNPGAASNSYIQLWDDKLRLDQMRQLGWQNPPVELLVLSACRTALGNEEHELGFAGLAFQAGVKSALASLWYVSDEGTLALMSKFYQNLKTVPIKAEALRQAQLAMLRGEVSIESGRLRGVGVVEAKEMMKSGVMLPPQLLREGNQNLKHPYYWSAFMMVGSPW